MLVILQLTQSGGAEDLVSETLRKYEYAFGISAYNGGNASNINSSASANPGASPSRNTIMNMSAYQSAQALRKKHYSQQT